VTIIFFFILGSIFGRNSDIRLKISHLSGGFYVFTTYNNYKGDRIPANGMYLLTNNGVVLFDSSWDTSQLQPLPDSVIIV
jgi:hypothetical protein